jgi:Protein of unknown function (DUF1302)
MMGRIAGRPSGIVATTRAPGLRGVLAIALFALAAFGSWPVLAADLYSADGFDIRWDNTLRYSAGFRVSPRDPKLLSNLNSDDGDRDFAPGLISNRIDLLSALDISRGDFGAHVSVAAWYDTVYHARTANDSPATYNPISVPDTQFSRAVRNLMGQDAEIEDAFAYGNFAVDDTQISLRLGRQAVLWGESLFFDENSIAAAQAPIDYIKALSTPEPYSENAFLPLNQLSVTVQPRPGIAISAYYQLEWRPARLPGVGSYFSYTDYLGAGDERVFVAPGQYLSHGTDQIPSAGGQYGVSLHATINDFDVGFYALRYNATYPIVTSTAAIGGGSGNVGEFELAYPTGIELYGASFSGYLGDSNIAGEVAARTNAPLPSISSASPHSGGQPPIFSGDSYAEGDTLHAQISSLTTLPPAAIWNSADLRVEAAANYLLDITQNYDALDPSQDNFAMNMRVLLELHYFEVLPDLDLGVPLGFGYNVVGRSSEDYAPNSGAGDFEVGLSATYLSVWKANLGLTCFLGGASDQPLADRDFISFSLERTF